MSELWQFHPAIAALRNRMSSIVAWGYARELALRGIAHGDHAGAMRHLRSMMREGGYVVDANPYPSSSPFHAAWQADFERNGAHPAALPDSVRDVGKPDPLVVTLPHVVEAIGARMAFDGDPLTANPYAPNDDRHRQWERGWLSEVARVVPKQKRRRAR